MTRSGTHLSINSFVRPDTRAFLAQSSSRSCGRVQDSYPPLSLNDISKSFRPQVSLQQVKTWEESRGTSTVRDVECTLPGRQRLSWLARHLSTICATANPIDFHFLHATRKWTSSSNSSSHSTHIVTRGRTVGITQPRSVCCVGSVTRGRFAPGHGHGLGSVRCGVPWTGQLTSEHWALRTRSSNAPPPLCLTWGSTLAWLPPQNLFECDHQCSLQTRDTYY